ncbi:MAG: FtsX-like permease family protein [Verrucomicrobia bacterium]|nr:FtsX-like permease family protein [Verrucomicrobiota bacterium]
MMPLTELIEGLRIAWDALRANRLRSALTTLGIVIGVVTVTLMGTAIEGLNRAFMTSISSMGADVLFVSRFSWLNNSYEDWIRSQSRREINYAQAQAVERMMTTARAVSPIAVTGQPVGYKNKNSVRVRVIGTTDQMLQTDNIAVQLGRFMTSGEVEGGRPVCVLGSQVASNLFVNEPPLGKRIKVGSAQLEVIGVLDKRGNFLGGFSMDNQVIVPLKQFMSSFWNFPYFEIQVRARSLAELDETKEELRGVMRKIRRVPPGVPDDFSINQQDMFIKTFEKVQGTIASAGLGLTGLSLFVGGIGIMNIMFVSVAERTREIGVRKAIGAKRRAILVQFLVEAALICLLAGLVGVAIAWMVTLGVNRIFPATMSLKVLAAALSVSALTGVVSGFLPAWRAARMNTVDALRSE